MNMSKQKNLIVSFWKAFKSESGAVTLIEAAFVFPVTFFVVAFMIYFGNMYYVKAGVDMVVSTQAIKGAQYYSNPWVEIVNEEGEGKKVPVKNNDVQPYRQIFSSKKIQNKIEKETEERIKNLGSGAFSGMAPAQVECEAKHRNFVIYSDFTVDVSYKITFPIRFFWQKENMTIDFSAHDVASVSDNAEFIRDVDMAFDYVEKTGWYNNLKDKIDGLKSKLGFDN